jgi:hypothetical protein
MAGYVILAVFVVVGVWLVIHVRRTPRFEGRRPFEPDDGGTNLGGEQKPTMPFNPPRGPDGGGFGF